MSFAEKDAWFHRPYGCNSLAEATEARWRRENRPKIAVQELVSRLKAARVAWEAVPQWCYRHEHPLRTGRPGKMYHKSDFVTPVMDAMTMIGEKRGSSDLLGLFSAVPRKKKQKKDGYDEAEEKEAACREQRALERSDIEVGTAAARKQPCGWQCACCGNTDVKSQVQHKDALLCPCGFVVNIGGPIVSTHREKLGAEEGDDKTQHADRPREERTDKYDLDHVPNPQERRNERKYASQISKLGGRGGHKLGRLCDVQRISEESAAKEQRVADVRCGIKLTPKEETKGYNIVEQVNALIYQLTPVDHAVKRCVRRAADGLWLRAVQHCRGCWRNGCCELRLVERPAATIASSVFELTIERLLHDDSDTDVCVTRQHLLDIQTRMQRSPAFTNPSAITQMNTVKAMINIIQAPDFDPATECAPALATREADTSKSKPSPIVARKPFARNDSSISTDGHSPTPTDAVQLRDAVSTVFLAHRSELPVSVRDGAYRAVQSPGFVDAIKGIKDLEPLPLQCTAFCILNAVQREQASTIGQSFGGGNVEAGDTLNVGVATRLRFDLAVAEESIQAIRAFVPSDAASEASGSVDDDLFS